MMLRQEFDSYRSTRASWDEIPAVSVPEGFAEKQDLTRQDHVMSGVSLASWEGNPAVLFPDALTDKHGLTQQNHWMSGTQELLPELRPELQQFVWVDEPVHLHVSSDAFAEHATPPKNTRFSPFLTPIISRESTPEDWQQDSTCVASSSCKYSSSPDVERLSTPPFSVPAPRGEWGEGWYFPPKPLDEDESACQMRHLQACLEPRVISCGF